MYSIKISTPHRWPNGNNYNTDTQMDSVHISTCTLYTRHRPNATRMRSHLAGDCDRIGMCTHYILQTTTVYGYTTNMYYKSMCVIENFHKLIKVFDLCHSFSLLLGFFSFSFSFIVVVVVWLPIVDLCWSFIRVRNASLHTIKLYRPTNIDRFDELNEGENEKGRDGWRIGRKHSKAKMFFERSHGYIVCFCATY